MDALLGFLGLLVIGYIGIFLLIQGFKVSVVVFVFLFGWMLNDTVDRQTPEDRFQARMRANRERENSPPKPPKPMILDSQNNVAARAERRLLQERKERSKENS